MKKVLSLLVALMCTLSLVACNGAKEEEAAARATVEGFLGAFVELDAEEMAKYIDDASAIPEEFTSLDVDTMMETLPTELDAYSEEFRGILTDFMAKVSEGIGYEIKTAEQADGDYVFTLDLTYPGDFDMDSIIGDSFSDEAVEGILTEMLESGEISESSSEDEIISAVMDKAVDMIAEAFEDVEIPTETEVKELTVSQKDGKWLVNSEKSFE